MMRLLVKEFLLAKSKDLEWSLKYPAKIARKLCEEYFYTPASEDRFISTAYGWFWGKTDNTAEANVSCFLLKEYMDKFYNKVSKENNW